MIAVVAVVVVFFAGMIGAQAVGLDIFGAIARWTDETFLFTTLQPVGENGLKNSTKAPRFQDSLEEALESCGFPKYLAPSWYPEGSAFVNGIEIDINDVSHSVGCSFSSGEGLYFNVTIEEFNDYDVFNTLTFQKDSSEVTEYISGDRLFYIFSNQDDTVATWSDGKLVFCVNGNISLDNIKQIIDSIGR